MNTSKWLIRTGYPVALVGLFFVSPLADLLPIDFWASLGHVFKPGKGSHTYYRVAPGEQSYLLLWALIAAGVAAVLVGHWLRRRKHRL